MSDLIAYVDGGSHGNPGPAGIGVVIEIAMARPPASPSGSVIRTTTSPNTLLCWKPCSTPLRSTPKPARVLRLGSRRQTKTGEYACRSARLHSLNWTCRKLARAVDFSIAHISREHNREANELANRAARGGTNPGP